MFDFIPDMAAKRAELSPDSRAFFDLSSDRGWTYSEVNAAADNLASALQRLGLKSNDHVAILTKNNAEFFVSLFACQKAGMILAPLNWRQPFNELKPVAQHLGIHAIIYDEDNQDVGQKLKSAFGVPSIGIRTEDAGYNFDDLTSSADKQFDNPIDANAVWYLLFTSGTTGAPKAVIQTAKMAWANAINIGQATSLTKDDCSVNYLPLFHTAGINLYTLPLFLNGGQTTIVPQFDADKLVEMIKTKSVTQFFGVPAIYQSIALRDDFDQLNFDDIRFGCGGAALPIGLIEKYAQRGAKICNGFGMTETGPTAFFMDQANAEKKIGSVGKVQALTNARLANVPNGQIGEGEVQFFGPAITPGYYKDPEATAKSFTEDGWLKSGDVGRRDEDGYVYIVDRIKDMYISGGENVYPAEVEKVLITHPNVIEAAVIGVEDEKWGEVGAAYLLVHDKQAFDEVSFSHWCRDHLAAYKIPKQFHLIDEFPRTAAGKIQKPKLKGLYQRAKV
jgi:fatty-acyl-CoA synthase